MIINHPLLGPRDSSEFTYRGDAVLLNRPDPNSESLLDDYYEYQYIGSGTKTVVAATVNWSETGPSSTSVVVNVGYGASNTACNNGN